MNIVDTIRSETAGLRGKTAVVDGAIELSYGGLLDAVDRGAAALREAGIQPLDRVAFLCEDSADYLIGSLALLQMGAVVVPVSPSLMADELDRILTRMAVSALLYDVSVRRSGNGRRIGSDAFVGRRFALECRGAPDAPDAAFGRMNPAFIRFSSGTTGESKGVLLSHETIRDRTDAADRAMCMTPADTVVWVLSMSFHYVVTILLYLRRGATILICRQPFPDSFLDAGRRHRGTLFYASPFHYHALAMSPQVARGSLGGIRLAVSTAVKLPAETADAFALKFGLELAEACGIIEVGLPFLNDAGRAKRGSVGRILPDYSMRVAGADAEGRGSILLRGKGMFDAYVSPWIPREAALSDGWFDSGDIGRVDEDGYLFISGRQKSVINFAGMKIFPAEVEEILQAHPAIAEAMVYGEPHPVYGQIPCARVVPRPGAVMPGTADVRRFCFERLAAHKVPKAVETVERLERTASGKLKR